MATVHIIGAGISGLAAATKLAAAHVPVKLYEASTSAGGRCRSSSDATLGRYDHGLHIFSGAARDLQQFIRRIDAQDQFTRIPSPVRVSDAASGESWKITRGLPWVAGPLLDHLQLVARTLLVHDAPVESLVPELSPLHDALLAPLARLALTQPTHRATAKQLQRLLRRRWRPGALKFFMAKESLQQAFIAPALHMLEYLGGSVYFGQSLKSYDTQRGELNFARKKLQLDPDDVIIIATPAYAAKALLPGIVVPEQQISAIVLHFACAHAQPAGSIRILTNAAADLLRYDEGVIRAELRVAEGAWAIDEETLARRVWKQVRALHGDLPAKLPEYAMWREKRAGHVPQAEKNPKPALPPRCLLAGDWLDATQAGTLEGAAKSGHRAAKQALAMIGKKAAPTQSDFYLN